MEFMIERLEGDEYYAVIVSYTDCCPGGGCHCSYGVIREVYFRCTAQTQGELLIEAPEIYQKYKDASAFGYEVVKVHPMLTYHFGD